MFKKAPNLEIFLQSKLKLDAEEGVGRLGSASGHELMIYEAPSLYSCIDRIRLNDCNLYFIRWISALYYTGGDQTEYGEQHRGGEVLPHLFFPLCGDDDDDDDYDFMIL